MRTVRPPVRRFSSGRLDDLVGDEHETDGDDGERRMQERPAR